MLYVGVGLMVYDVCRKFINLLSVKIWCLQTNFEWSLIDWLIIFIVRIWYLCVCVCVSVCHMHECILSCTNCNVLDPFTGGGRKYCVSYTWNFPNLIRWNSVFDSFETVQTYVLESFGFERRVVFTNLILLSKRMDEGVLHTTDI